MKDVVFVTVDSLRADHVGWHGYERNTTPNLDAIADRSNTYSKAFAHACGTPPSFSAIMTSTYPLMYGGYQRLSEERVTLAETLAGAGFQTAGFHSNLYLSADFGYDRGFQQFFDSKQSSGTLARARQAVKIHLNRQSRLYEILQRAFDATERRAGIELGSAYVDAADITDRALRWAQSAGSGPRFLWVHYMDPHHPYTPPREHQLRFRDTAIEQRDAIRLRQKMLESPGALTEQENEELLDLYDAEISFADAEIGRLYESVMAAWGDDTVFVLTADHGEEFGEHGGYSHTPTFYDEQTHVPLVLDDGAQHDRYTQLVGLLDVAPTITEAAGVESSGSFLGTPLQKVGTDMWERTAVIAEWADRETGDRSFGVRTNGWKYIQDVDGSEELYDTDADPDETVDCSQTAEARLQLFRDQLKTHKKLLAQYQGQSLDEVEMEEAVKQRLRDLGYKE
jgi:arylsulfatase A-like enzyme